MTICPATHASCECQPDEGVPCPYAMTNERTPAEPKCEFVCACAACEPAWWGMYLCNICGNKRCPHAADHRNACTGSNEPGQPGSLYPRTPAEAEPHAGEAELVRDLCEWARKGIARDVYSKRNRRMADDIKAAADLILSLRAEIERQRKVIEAADRMRKYVPDSIINVEATRHWTAAVFDSARASLSTPVGEK